MFCGRGKQLFNWLFQRRPAMSNWLDFKSIKREANLESVLRHYRVDLRRSGKDQYRGCCPIHRGHGRDAFHANMDRNRRGISGAKISRISGIDN